MVSTKPKKSIGAKSSTHKKCPLQLRPERVLSGLSDIKLPQKKVIGTLSFPVCGTDACPIYDNTDIIIDVIKKRKPSLLLCAGHSIPEGRLRDVIAATGGLNTVLVLETCEGMNQLPPPEVEVCDASLGPLEAVICG